MRDETQQKADARLARVEGQIKPCEKWWPRTATASTWYARCRPLALRWEPGDIDYR